MYFAKQNKIKIIISLYSIFCSLVLIFLLISSCANSLNEENYLACKKNLETDRQKAREGAYSYKSQSYEECRAPAIYRISEE